MGTFNRIPMLLLATSLATQAGWDKCKFLFGQAWDGPNATYSSESDFITIWLGNGGGSNTYNSFWEGDMLRRCKSGGSLAGKAPVIYSYITAELAKVKGGLKDCDVAGQGSSVSLCTQGAKFIRANRATIVQKYQDFAQGVAKDWGTTDPVVWLMEPDFFQYTEPSSHWGTMDQPLTQTEAVSLMTDMVAKIKAALPNALISMDISPWMGGSNWQSAQTSWWNALPKSSFSYRNTSGGRTQGNNDRLRSDNNNLATWGGISQLSGLGIIADDGYGTAGATSGDWVDWMSASTLNARIANGVVALAIPKPGDWSNQIKGLRSQLNKPTTCGGSVTPTSYLLTLSGTTNGTIAANTVQPSGGYPSGTIVTVTATPGNGYQLGGWTGACSGTGSCSITMDAAKTVGATFTAIPVTKFALTISSTTNGSITPNPTQPSGGYASGTVVTVNATPSTGYQLSGWTGACSGTSNCSVTMDAAKTVGATFTTIPVTKFALTISSTTNGSITPNPAQPSGGYASGTVVTVNATPSTGYQLSGWTGACSGTGSCSITMDAAKTVGATFVSKTASVSDKSFAATRRFSISGSSLQVDLTDLDATALELRSIDGRNATVLAIESPRQFLSIQTTSLRAGVWMAILRTRHGSHQELVNILR